MILYYMAGGCSMAVHISALEAGLELDLVKMVIHPDGTKTADGADFKKVNPKGKTPALTTDDGLLTEVQAILQYVASLAPDKLPIPASGFSRFRFLETLNFIASDIHRGFGPLFSPVISAEHKQAVIGMLKDSFTVLQDLIGDRHFVFGDHFTVADAYAFTVTGWAALFGIDVADWPALASWREQIGQRPAVVQAMRREDLIK